MINFLPSTLIMTPPELSQSRIPALRHENIIDGGAWAETYWDLPSIGISILGFGCARQHISERFCFVML